MFTVTLLLLIGALVMVLASAAGKVPLWVSVLLVTLALLLERLPK